MQVSSAFGEIEHTIIEQPYCGIKTASAFVQVELTDGRNPSKNGVYIVEEVTTSLGTRGYRQKVSIPYRVSKKETYGEGKQK